MSDRLEGPGSQRDLSLLSVVVPMYNEAAVAARFHQRLHTALVGVNFELIAIDDGSTDETSAVLRRLAGGDARIRIVRLSRNFGHQAALTAGLDHARGEAVVTIDADLQDPPELIPTMIAKWRQGADIVYAVRRSRAGERRRRLLAIRGFYRLFTRIAKLEHMANSGDFRLFDRRALQVLLFMRERNRYLRGMSSWVGFDQVPVYYERDARYAGETKYPVSRLIQLAADAIASFSYVPLRVAALLGLVFSVIALAGIPVVLALRLTGSYVPGIASVHIVMLLLGGIQLLTLGIMGEYLGRTYDEAKHRPIYVVAERHNLPEVPVPALPEQVAEGAAAVTRHPAD